jgi:hypothetical protein
MDDHGQRTRDEQEHADVEGDRGEELEGAEVDDVRPGPREVGERRIAGCNRPEPDRQRDEEPAAAVAGACRRTGRPRSASSTPRTTYRSAIASATITPALKPSPVSW